MSKLEIYLVRHGETEWNVEGRLQGWLDSKLTNRGQVQVEFLRSQLQVEEFHAIYSSPSGRAVETAQILVGNKIKILQDARLQEIHLGSWQGRLIKDILKDDFVRFEAYNKKPASYLPDGGESFQQVGNRMFEFINECARIYRDNRILVVTHAVAIRSLLIKSLGLPVQNIWEIGEIDGASVTKLVVENNQINVEYVGKKPSLNNDD